jgi:hypothetical protein
MDAQAHPQAPEGLLDIPVDGVMAAMDRTREAQCPPVDRYLLALPLLHGQPPAAVQVGVLGAPCWSRRATGGWQAGPRGGPPGDRPGRCQVAPVRSAAPKPVVLGLEGGGPQFVGGIPGEPPGGVEHHAHVPTAKLLRHPGDRVESDLQAQDAGVKAGSHVLDPRGRGQAGEPGQEPLQPRAMAPAGPARQDGRLDLLEAGGQRAVVDSCRHQSVGLPGEDRLVDDPGPLDRAPGPEDQDRLGLGECAEGQRLPPGPGIDPVVEPALEPLGA